MHNPSVIAYPPGETPDHWRPNPATPAHRFVLGRAPRIGGSPLVVVGMNPSHASDLVSDRTVNRVIEASHDLGYDGWTMLNVYPERSTSPRLLTPFDQGLSDANVQAVLDHLSANRVTEVWGAWGDVPHRTLVLGLADVLAALKQHRVRVFTFGRFTDRGHPRHPSPPGYALDWRQPQTYWL